MQNDISTLEKTLVQKFKKMSLDERIMSFVKAKMVLDKDPAELQDEEVQEARITVKLLELPDRILLAL